MAIGSGYICKQEACVENAPFHLPTVLLLLLLVLALLLLLYLILLPSSIAHSWCREGLRAAWH